MKTRLLTSDDGALIRALRVEREMGSAKNYERISFEIIPMHYFERFN